jgi:hypothetical protein
MGEVIPSKFFARSFNKAQFVGGEQRTLCLCGGIRGCKIYLGRKANFTSRKNPGYSDF